MNELAENQVKLSDGRVVEMREQMGNDEMIVAGQLGDLFTPDGAGAMIFSTCLIVRTIKSIDGVDFVAPKNYAGVRDFLGGLKQKDWSKIRDLSTKLNSDAEGNDSASE